MQFSMALPIATQFVVVIVLYQLLLLITLRDAEKIIRKFLPSLHL